MISHNSLSNLRFSDITVGVRNTFNHFICKCPSSVEFQLMNYNEILMGESSSPRSLRALSNQECKVSSKLFLTKLQGV